MVPEPPVSEVESEHKVREISERGTRDNCVVSRLEEGHGSPLRPYGPQTPPTGRVLLGRPRFTLLMVRHGPSP